MEDISRDREEERDRFIEGERLSSRRKKVFQEILPEMSYEEYSKSAQKDMNTILSSDYYKKRTVNIDNKRKEVKDVRRYILNYLTDIPAKFNFSTSSSRVFKETRLEKDKRNLNSSIIYVRYEGSIICTYDLNEDFIGDERIAIVSEEKYQECKRDLEREVEEFKKRLLLVRLLKS